MRIYIKCNYCGKGKYKRQRHFLEHHYCSPACYQKAIKKHKNWKTKKHTKTAFKYESEFEFLEKQIKQIKERNEWGNYIKDINNISED